MGIELGQPWRLRSRIAKLEAQLNGGELRCRPGEQQIAVADRMQSAGAAKGAADLMTADGLADMGAPRRERRGSRTCCPGDKLLLDMRNCSGSRENTENLGYCRVLTVISQFSTDPVRSCCQPKDLRRS